MSNKHCETSILKLSDFSAVFNIIDHFIRIERLLTIFYLIDTYNWFYFYHFKILDLID